MYAVIGYSKEYETGEIEEVFANKEDAITATGILCMDMEHQDVELKVAQFDEAWLLERIKLAKEEHERDEQAYYKNACIDAQVPL